MSTRNTKADAVSEVSVLIKTFQRPRTVNTAIASIRRFYPSITIILADDSREPTPIDDPAVVVHRLPFDSGVGKGRNFLVSQARTKYFLMIDDDNHFSHHTRIERMIDLLEQGDLDILGCLVVEGASWLRPALRPRRHIIDFQMDLELNDGILRFSEPSARYERSTIRCDIVHQFFLARTVAVGDTGGWDDRLKTGDHTDFFLKMKHHGLKVGFTPTVAAWHGAIGAERNSPAYAPFRRDRVPEFRRIWVESNRIRKLIGRNGREMDADEFIQSSSGAGKLGNLVRRPAPPGFLFWNRLRWYARALLGER